MEILHCLFMLWILNVRFLIQNVTNVVGGRHHNHMNKKQKSEIPSEVAPADFPDQSPIVPADSPLPQPGNISRARAVFSMCLIMEMETLIALMHLVLHGRRHAEWKMEWFWSHQTRCFLLLQPFFKDPVKVDGVLKQLDGPDSWPESDSTKQWLVFYNLDGFTFTGAR